MVVSPSQKYCIGWIPHVDGFCDFEGCWEDIVNDRKNEENKTYHAREFFSLKGNTKGFFFKPNEWEGLEKFRFDFKRISPYYDCTESKVKDLIKIFITFNYIAQCRPLDDTDPSPRWFFVFTFEDNNLTIPNDVYIFLSQKKYIYPGTFFNPVDDLRYLATVKIQSIDPIFGFVTLSLEDLGANIECVDPPEKPESKVLHETFFAIRDVLHIHTHHFSSPSASDDEVPDSITNAVITSKNSIDAEIAMDLFNEYKQSLVNNFHVIADKTIRLEGRSNAFQLKKDLYSEYWSIASLMKQSGGVEIYAKGLLSALLKKSSPTLVLINKTSYDENLKSLKDMDDTLNTFYEDLTTRFQILNAKGSDKLLFPALILTLWILFFEARHFDTLLENQYLIIIPIVLTFGVYYYCNSNY